MVYRRNWILVIVVILGVAMFVPVAQAQRQEFEGVSCAAQTLNVAHSSPEVTIVSFDNKSIYQSTDENKLFDNWMGMRSVFQRGREARRAGMGLTK